MNGLKITKIKGDSEHLTNIVCCRRSINAYDLNLERTTVKHFPHDAHVRQVSQQVESGFWSHQHRVARSDIWPEHNGQRHADGWLPASLVVGYLNHHPSLIAVLPWLCPELWWSSHLQFSFSGEPLPASTVGGSPTSRKPPSQCRWWRREITLQLQLDNGLDNNSAAQYFHLFVLRLLDGNV